MNITALVSRLSEFYWSAKHPSSYVVTAPHNQQPAGLGLLASQDYAAFNIIFAQYENKLFDIEGHKKACHAFYKLSDMPDKENSCLNQEVLGNQLRDYITLMNRKEFSVWYKAHRGRVDQTGRLWIDPILPEYARVQQL